jgi:hypothetical protein
MVVCLALSVVAGTFGADPAAAARRAPARGCHPRGSEVIGRRGGEVVFRHVIRTGGQYGTTYRYYGCLKPSQRPRALYSGGEQSEITMLHPFGGNPVFQGSYATWAEEEGDVACGKYTFGEPCPSISTIEAWDLRSGRRICTAAAAPAALALTAGGLVVWVEDPTLALVFCGPAGERLLSIAPVEPQSLKVSGNTVSWQSEAHTHSVALTYPE